MRVSGQIKYKSATGSVLEAILCALLTQASFNPARILVQMNRTINLRPFHIFLRPRR